MFRSRSTRRAILGAAFFSGALAGTPSAAATDVNELDLIRVGRGRSRPRDHPARLHPSRLSRCPLRRGRGAGGGAAAASGADLGRPAGEGRGRGLVLRQPHGVRSGGDQRRASDRLRCGSAPARSTPLPISSSAASCAPPMEYVVWTGCMAAHANRVRTSGVSLMESRTLCPRSCAGPALKAVEVGAAEHAGAVVVLRSPSRAGPGRTACRPVVAREEVRPVQVLDDDAGQAVVDPPQPGLEAREVEVVRLPGSTPKLRPVTLPA
jgi:hypothetical protein